MSTDTNKAHVLRRHATAVCLRGGGDAGTFFEVWASKQGPKLSVGFSRKEAWRKAWLRVDACPKCGHPDSVYGCSQCQTGDYDYEAAAAVQTPEAEYDEHGNHWTDHLP